MSPEDQRNCGREMSTLLYNRNRKQNIRRKMSWISDDEPSSGRDTLNTILLTRPP